MDTLLKSDILSILAAAPDLTIATIREDGYPQATTVSFVADGMTIYFGCGATSQKARNLAHCDKVSLTVTLPYTNWAEIRGLSLAGRAERVTDPEEMAKVGRLMMAKFPSIADFVSLETAGGSLYRVTPEIVSVLNYQKGFGHTDLVRVDTSEA